MPTPPIGAVFTPRGWAKWLLKTQGIVDLWLAGATLLDPTCGEGEFLFAAIELALAQGLSPQDLPLERLFGIEREPAFLEALVQRAQSEFGVSLQTVYQADLLTQPLDLRADILVGNPPWQNFADLPPDYKEELKPLFVEYGLVPNPKSLLLGGSRIDLAALVVAKALTDHLYPGGKACFFLPLSLFLNDGAHEGFRQWQAKGITWALQEIWDFRNLGVFDVGTRYGVACFSRDAQTQYPIPYHQWNGDWEETWAGPVFGDSPLSIARTPQALTDLGQMGKIRLPKESRPRQGVNTCGANGVFLFEDLEDLNDGLVMASSELGRYPLPSQFLYPLMDFRAKSRRFVLLPYEPSGRPLSLQALQTEPRLWEYLQKARPILEKRKGRMIGAWIQKGIWWALLGVGPYAFWPYKVAWPAYGQSRFQPQIFSSGWQGNQALHTYIPCHSLEEAKRVLEGLLHPQVEAYLHSFQMSGTRSWAQPGRISKLLQLE